MRGNGNTNPGDKARAQLIAFAECLTDAGRHGDAQSSSAP
jgi:hypothetical protein